MSTSIISISTDGTNYTALKDPSALTVSLMDIDASTTTRAADGTMLRDRICGGATSKRKLALEWNAVQTNTATSILQAIADEFFWVKYPDPYTGTMRTCKMYAGDRNIPMKSFVMGNSGGILWEKLSVGLIEK